MCIQNLAGSWGISERGYLSFVVLDVYYPQDEVFVLLYLLEMLHALDDADEPVALGYLSEVVDSTLRIPRSVAWYFAVPENCCRDSVIVTSDSIVIVRFSWMFISSCIRPRSSFRSSCRGPLSRSESLPRSLGRA